MNIGLKYRIIWAHKHIGSLYYCHDLKQKFQTVLAPITYVHVLESDPLENLFSTFPNHQNPIIFVDNEHSALELITTYALDKNIILISSGSMGHQIIEQMIAKDLYIHSYYILCTNMINHIEWALECLEMSLNIQMFIHENDLLVCLARDMSDEFIGKGKKLLTSNAPDSALIVFEQAWSLAENAIQYETPSFAFDIQRSFIRQQQMLNGNNGLIQQARQAIEAKTKTYKAIL